MRLKSPAKLNLYLNVLGKRPDGYHEIETVFEAIDLCDEVSFKETKQGIGLFPGHPDLPADSANLAYKAAELLSKKAKTDKGVEIRLLKRIPIAAGLGGGSSNAATVLLGLNRLWDLGLSKEELMDIGRSLGADVPFFISGHPMAIGRGRGDQLTPLPDSSKREYVLICPNLRIASKDIYSAWDAAPCAAPSGYCLEERIRSLTKEDNKAKIWDNSLRQDSAGLKTDILYNSLENVVLSRFSIISEIKEALKALGIRRVAMSGSGPVVFGIVSGRKEAADVQRKLCLDNRPWQVIITKTYHSYAGIAT